MDRSQKRSVFLAAEGSAAGIHFVLLGFGLAAPLLTYWIAVSEMSGDRKVTLLVGLSVVYAAICVWSVMNLKKEAAREDTNNNADLPDLKPEFRSKLSALDDAREFFGSSLKPADMFRLVSTRVKDMVPFTDCVLLTRTDVDRYVVHNAFGPDSAKLEKNELVAPACLAGISYLSGEVEVLNDLSDERPLFPEGSLDSARSSVVIPLKHQGDVFAVYQLFFDTKEQFTSEMMETFEAVSEKVAPIFLGSLAFESSLSRALTDPLTNLPNERAFQMVLENQLAESQRFRDERPLTVLAVDIKNFDELNRSHGHAFGDRVLTFASQAIASQLRKMDFLSRSMNDEFLIVLPKASERTASEIIGRIRLHLAQTPIEVSESESLKVWLNFGSATFWRDGENIEQLVRNAYLRKQHSKSAEVNNVVDFPKEYVN